MKKLAVIAIMVCSLFVSFAAAKSMSLKLSNAEIDNYIAQNPDLPDFDKSALLSGDFQVGILATTLKFMLGEPKKVTTIKQPWATQEEWLYKVNKSNLYFTIEKGGVVGIEER